ncbi:DamX protein [Pseudoalteromonas translucida KMM 520]|uniref:DamX protein n=1 Tax=Pseudoalteromonas translucida KMM 520 TaxID=1315283 RepID=A0A0U2X2S9_9GAMM|nr:AAA family ATPase [Pseudoalteromonas translucida]ALS34249.1 DamX protein [Pseudoalteromonas translucida KMM 520]
MQPQILPSRAALVDRIALQFEYGQNLIVLLGTSGLGKSYLLETFITDKYNDFNKAFVQVTAQMTDIQLMSELLEQSFNAPLIDHSLSLSENFYQLLQQQACGPCLWVLDNARHLSEELQVELELLAKNSPSTLYIMLAAQSKLAFTAAINIHLEPLNQSESKQLMSWYFSDLPYDEDPVYQAFIAAAQGNPNLLLSWQATEHIADVVVKDKVSWRLHLLILMLIILFLIIGLLYKSDMTQWWQQYYQQAEPEVLTTAISVKQIQQPLATASDNSVITASPNLPASTVELQTPKNDVPAIMQSLTAKQATSSSQNAPLVERKVLATQQHSNISAQVESKTLTGNAWYLQQPETNTVIQLLAITQQQVSAEFISQHKLQKVAHTYQTKRNNKTWWVVTLGSFTNMNAAKLAMNALPAEVKVNKPFYKKISKIKQEIVLVDQ